MPFRISTISRQPLYFYKLTMAGSTRFNWIRVVVAIFLAEALPILLLVAVVFVYSLIRQPESASPDEFAPRAGLWIGPIGGFLATLLFAWWAARHAVERKLASGMAVGFGTAFLDFGILLGAADALQPIFFISNGGRILAGVLGGWFAMRQPIANRKPAGPQDESLSNHG
jgi:hypothetical protein